MLLLFLSYHLVSLISAVFLFFFVIFRIILRIIFHINFRIVFLYYIGFMKKFKPHKKNAQPASLSNLCVLLSSILPSAHLGCRSPVSILSYSACASETLTLWSYHTPLVPIKARSNSLFNSLTGTSNALTSSLVPSE